MCADVLPGLYHITRVLSLPLTSCMAHVTLGNTKSYDDSRDGIARVVVRAPEQPRNVRFITSPRREVTAYNELRPLGRFNSGQSIFDVVNLSTQKETSRDYLARILGSRGLPERGDLYRPPTEHCLPCHRRRAVCHGLLLRAEVREQVEARPHRAPGQPSRACPAPGAAADHPEDVTRLEHSHLQTRQRIERSVMAVSFVTGHT